MNTLTFQIIHQHIFRQRKVWGYSMERFLNLCGNHDILVWDIEDHGDHVTMKVSIQGFFALKTLLKKFS